MDDFRGVVELLVGEEAGIHAALDGVASLEGLGVIAA